MQYIFSSIAVGSYISNTVHIHWLRCFLSLLCTSVSCFCVLQLAENFETPMSDTCTEGLTCCRHLSLSGRMRQSLAYLYSGYKGTMETLLNASSCRPPAAAGSSKCKLRKSTIHKGMRNGICARTYACVCASAGVNSCNTCGEGKANFLLTVSEQHLVTAKTEWIGHVKRKIITADSETFPSELLVRSVTQTVAANAIKLFPN